VDPFTPRVDLFATLLSCTGNSVTVDELAEEGLVEARYDDHVDTSCEEFFQPSTPDIYAPPFIKSYSKFNRDEVKAKKALSPEGWKKISLQLKVWWWFKREVLEKAHRRNVDSFDWVKNPEIGIPTRDGVADGGKLLRPKRWNAWFHICKQYETDTLGSPHYRVEFDVDNDGLVHGLVVVSNNQCSYRTIRDNAVMYAECLDERDYLLLKKAGLESMFKGSKMVEGDDLNYYFGIGSLISHRCDFEVRFSSISKRTKKYQIGTLFKRRFFGSRLKVETMSGGIKKFWMKNEIVCVCYADGTWFAGGCRCPKHRNTPQRSRDSEIQDTREDTYSNDDDAHDDDYCEVKPNQKVTSICFSQLTHFNLLISRKRVASCSENEK
jgi:hypothetical protein